MSSETTSSFFLVSSSKTANLLRRRLGPGIKLRLNNHRLKDYFINHHERTELNTATLSIPGVIGSYLAFSSPFIPATPYFYDPVFRKYQCDGLTFDIQDIAAALYTLKGIVKNERDKRLRDHEAVTSSINLGDGVGLPEISRYRMTPLTWKPTNILMAYRKFIH